MDDKEKEEYPGEFKDNVIKIILLLPTIVFAGLYFFYDDNQLYLWLFLGLGLLELIIFQFIRKKKNIWRGMLSWITKKRKENAIWIGDGAEGNGVITAQSGALEKMPYSFKTRFENDEGKLGTNPEELIAAAHAGCFNMKLSFVLNEAGYSPEELNTDAVLTFEDGKILSIELNLSAKVSDVSKEEFEELAEDAKIYLPISVVLICDIILIPTLT